MSVFGTKSKEKLVGVHPMLVLLMGYAIKDTPIDFSIDQGVRSTKQQQEFYSWGRTVVNPNTGPIKGNKYGMIVTTRDGIIRPSNHQVKSDGFGRAVDIYAYYDGKLHTNDVKSLEVIIPHIEKCAKELNIKIICGLRWKTLFDPPHIELA